MSRVAGKKILIIRFSSFGDIIFTLSILPILKKYYGVETRIDWLLRSDMQSILKDQEDINRLWSFERKEGLGGLCRLAWRLRKEDYDIVYDAHANLRSFVVRVLLSFFKQVTIVVRSKERWKRFLLFKLRINRFEWPYRAMHSFLRPLKEQLGIEGTLTEQTWPQTGDHHDRVKKGAIVLVPGTAWPMKTWPQQHWEKLVELLADQHFVVLGGPDDLACQAIADTAPDRVVNLAGQLSLFESCTIVSRASFVITADTGLAQVADLTGRRGITMIGPTAFGYPCMGTMKVAQVDLPCRPCTKDGRGSCSQDVYQKCMVELTPEYICSLAKAELGQAV